MSSTLDEVVTACEADVEGDGAMRLEERPDKDVVLYRYGCCVKRAHNLGILANESAASRFKNQLL